MIGIVLHLDLDVRFWRSVHFLIAIYLPGSVPSYDSWQKLRNFHVWPVRSHRRDTHCYLAAKYHTRVVSVWIKAMIFQVWKDVFFCFGFPVLGGIRVPKNPGGGPISQTMDDSSLRNICEYFQHLWPQLNQNNDNYSLYSAALCWCFIDSQTEIMDTITI